MQSLKKNFHLKYLFIEDDTWEKTYRIPAHDMGVTAVSWCPLLKLDDISQVSPEGQLSSKFATSSQDNKTKIWEFNNGKNKKK